MISVVCRENSGDYNEEAIRIEIFCFILFAFELPNPVCIGYPQKTQNWPPGGKEALSLTQSMPLSQLIETLVSSVCLW